MIHPSEIQLQEYACEETETSVATFSAHIMDCDKCSAKVELYRQLKVVIASSSIEVIDEEVLYSLIKPRLVAYKPVDPMIPWLFTLFVFCLGLLLVWTPDPGLHFNLPPVLIMVLTCLLGFFVLEYRYSRTNYNHKINAF